MIESIDLQQFSEKIGQVRTEIGKGLVGQSKMVDLLLAAMFSGGHVLIEGVPGVAKTLTSRLLAAVADVDFKRIQFTPDLMPSDILGTSVFNPRSQEFTYRRGPVFSNMVLIDEINRAPAKTQAALFEVMEERQVTNDGVKYVMDDVFMIVATQNPIEQEGTYRLPEAQLDRFLFKVAVDYPTLEEEARVLELANSGVSYRDLVFVDKVLGTQEIVAMSKFISELLIKPDLLKYIASLMHQTRSHTGLYLGASPRASVDLMRSSKAFAAMQGRDYVTPEDIQYLFPSVVQHRMVLTPESELQGVSVADICGQIIRQVEVPK